MSLNRSLRTFLAFLFTLAIAACSSHAQSLTTGDIAGTISDPSGGVVPNAKVTLKNSTQGTEQSTQTSTTGAYRFSLLAPGRYIVTITAPGFDSVSREAVVALGSVATVDIALQVGKTTETITVSSELPLVNTENGNVANSISELQVSQVPNPGNDITYPVQMTAGVVANTGGGGLGNFAANGISASSNLFTLDGMDSNDPYLNLNNSGATNLTLGQNEIQEVSVVTNGYSGQYGGLAGANVNYITRSGGNEFHGRAIWYWNGSALNANSFFNNLNQAPKSFVNANQWGADLGGPIKKDKLFFYFNTEGLRLVIPTSSQGIIPSPQFAAATLANINSTHPDSLPYYQNIFDLYKGATGASRAADTLGPGSIGSGPGAVATGDGCGTFQLSPQFVGAGAAPCALAFQSSVSSKTHDALYTGRVDYNLSNSDRAYVRIEKEHGLQASFTDPINSLFNFTSDQPQWQGQLNETHAFRNGDVNQFILSGQWYSALFTNPNRTGALAVFPTTIQMGDGSLSNLGGFDFNLPQGRRVTQYQISDDYSRVMGRHTFKAGFKFRRNDVSDFAFGVNSIGTLSVSNLNALYAGGNDPVTGSSTTLTQVFPNKLEQPMAFYALAFYGEDDWKVKPNLTFTFALRIEHPSDPVCQTNCFARSAVPWDQLVHDPTIPYNQAIKTGLHSVLPSLTSVEPEPRFSFAWSPLGHSRNTVVRGGIGLFYDQFQGQVVDFIAENPPLINGFSASGDNISPAESSNLFKDASSSNAAFLQGFAGGATLAQLQASVPGFSPPALFSTDAKTKAPQYQKWNLELEQGFGRATSFTVNYVGNHGIHELMGNSAENAFCNPVTPTGPNPACPTAAGFVGLPTEPVDPRFGAVAVVKTLGVSNYNGLQLTAQHRFSAGEISVNYTWSHALDMTSNAGLNSLSNVLFGASTTSPLVSEDPNNPRRSYGNADYDIRHYLSANYVWELPLMQAFREHGPGFLLNGWQVAGSVFARSGLPFTPVDNSETSALSGSNYGTGFGTIFQEFAFANVTGPVSSNCSKATLSCYSAANFSTDVNPVTGVAGFGNATRNSLRGPSFFDADFSVLKKTKIPGWEHGEFGLGFQFFNVFNHPNFDLPVNNVASPQFGKLVHAAFSPTTIFGSGLGADASPRIIQLKLQLTF
jgi:Carboxypeptidase regulatory-like domain